MGRFEELDRFLAESLPAGREQIPWPLMATVLVLGRLCDASRELHLAEHFYESSALAECFWQLHLAHFGSLIWPTLSY